MEEENRNGEPLKEGQEKRKSRKTSPGRRIAYSAIGSALSVVLIVISCYLPLTVLPLVLISLSLNIIMEKCGLLYGIISMGVTGGLGFLFCSGHLGIMIIVGVVFLPYSLICRFLRKLDYTTVKGALIRGITVAAFMSLAFLALFFMAELIAEFVDIATLFEKIGNIALAYSLVNVMLAAGAVIIDIIYLKACRMIIPKLK